MDQNIIQMLPLIGAALVFYFLLVRPNQKKAKEQKEFSQNIAKGDVVVTNSGILGKVNKVDEANGLINLQVDGKTYLKVLPDAISKELSEAMASKEVEI